jgi:DNA-binding response OmpR family regulator
MPLEAKDARHGCGPSLLGRRVLVIEDEYFIADEICRVLVDIGANVLGPVPDMETGMALLADMPVDCAVLDIDLHGRSVFPFARELRARNVPWIYVTGYDSPAIPGDLAGMAHIEKPIDKAALMVALGGLV